MSGEAERKKEFGRQLIQFYKGYVTGSAEAVRTLANIQTKFKEEYELLKQVKDDPMLLEKLTDRLSEKEKDVLILVFTRASFLGVKITNLFDLTAEQQNELATELDKFAEFIEEKFKELEDKDVSSKGESEKR